MENSKLTTYDNFSLLVLHTCETWSTKVLLTMLSKYMWLQLWFSNMPFYHEMWSNHTHEDKNVGVFKLEPTQTCVHMNSYGKGVIYPDSLDVEYQNPVKSECGWHTNLHQISMLYFNPHLVNNEHPLIYNSLFN